uniref:Cyclic nucleotide-binding domain-containing protein n=1 Tax=Chrysotila carterae TaxID=13221 RepID=A0A7S4EUB9_CHRCT
MSLKHVFGPYLRLADRVSLLRPTPLGIFLDEEGLKALASYCTVVAFTAGETLADHAVYVLARGTGVVVDEAHPQEPLRRLAPDKGGSRLASDFQLNGDRLAAVCTSFHTRRSTPVVGQSASKLRGSVRGMLFPGQQQVLHGDTKFVVHAKSDGQALVLTHASLAKMAATDSLTALAHAVRKVQSLDEKLAKAPLLQEVELHSDQASELKEMTYFQLLEPGTVLFDQQARDDGEQLFIVLMGSVQWSVDEDADKSRELRSKNLTINAIGSGRRKMGAGQTMGLTAVMLGFRRPGDAQAVARSLIAVVPRDKFRQFVSRIPRLKNHVELQARMRILWTFRAARVPLFAEAQDEVLEGAAEDATIATLPPHSAVSNAGVEAGRFLYVVVQGTVLAHNDSHNYSTVLMPGQSFGDLPLMLSRNAWDAIYTTGDHSDCLLMMIPKQTFLAQFSRLTSTLSLLHLKLLRHKSKLQAVVGATVTRSLFTRYMRAHDNADLLLAFCIAIAKHAKVHEAGLVNAAREIGQEIISEYVDVNAPFRVVLPGTWSQDLLAARADGTLDSELLMRTREEVVNVIEEHYLPGFFQSSIFEEVLLTLGSDETVQARSLVLPNQLSAVQRLDATALLGAQEASPSVMDASKRSSRFSSALLRRVRASGMMMSSRREEQHRGEADSHWLESSLCGPSRRVDLEGICTTIDEFSVAQRPLEDLSWA